jgi:hypothetical protein
MGNLNKGVIKFMGKRVYVDKFGGGYLWGELPSGGSQMLANFEIRGWGAIQNLFLTKKGQFVEGGEKKAKEFQDSMQQFIVDAINEKIERER